MAAVARVRVCGDFSARPFPKKREQELMTKVNALQKGDQVIIPGGIIGTVAGFKDNAIEVKIAENVKLTVLKTAIVGFPAEMQPAAQEGGAK